MRRFYPTRLLLGISAFWLVLGMLASWQALLLPLWVASLILTLALLAIEAVRLWRLPPPDIARRIAPALPLAVWQTVELTLRQPGLRSSTFDITEHLAADMEAEGMPRHITLQGSRSVLLSYRLRSLVRGERHISACELLLHGPLRLLRLRRVLPVSSTVKVYPNFSEVAKYALLATDNRLSQLGIRVRPRRGEGLEFHQLREYRSSDSPRQVDWKATSRLRKLISREYQDERDQQVMLVLDTGFRMRAQDNALSHFDQALNAALLLTHVVAQQGDAIGLMTFAGYDRYLQPRKGRGMVNLVMNAVFDLQPTLHTPDYLRTVQELSRRLSKRSLIVFMTNLRDEDGEDLLEACRALGSRHLVMLAILREQIFDDLNQSEVATLDDAFTLVAAEDYLSLRQKSLLRLSHAGALVLDTTPAQLPVRLVNRYLDVKRSGRL
jgi:uncharacterized protein (DUF58 family)